MLMPGLTIWRVLVSELAFLSSCVCYNTASYYVYLTCVFVCFVGEALLAAETGTSCQNVAGRFLVAASFAVRQNQVRPRVQA